MITNATIRLHARTEREDIQNVIWTHPEILEKGLMPLQQEYQLPSGRVDCLFRNGEVMIPVECAKAGTYNEREKVAQILGYMADLKSRGHQVRGYLVGENWSPEVCNQAKLIPDLKVIELTTELHYVSAVNESSKNKCVDNNLSRNIRWYNIVLKAREVRALTEEQITEEQTQIKARIREAQEKEQQERRQLREELEKAQQAEREVREREAREREKQEAQEYEEEKEQERWRQLCEQEAQEKEAREQEAREKEQRETQEKKKQEAREKEQRETQEKKKQEAREKLGQTTLIVLFGLIFIVVVYVVLMILLRPDNVLVSDKEKQVSSKTNTIIDQRFKPQIDKWDKYCTAVTLVTSDGVLLENVPLSKVGKLVKLGCKAKGYSSWFDSADYLQRLCIAAGVDI